MTAPVSLVLPQPTLAFKALGSSAEMEQPVQLGLPDVRLPDGTTLSGGDVRTLGAYVYRTGGSSEQVWNDGAKQWQLPPPDLDSLSALGPVPLTAKQGAAPPWQGTLVAIGTKDGSGADQFAAASNGLPRYYVRAFARAERAGIVYRGLSAPSATLTFASGSDRQLFGAVLTPNDARTCQTARLHLKSSGGADAGYLEFRATGAAEVELANCDAGGAPRARILLTADGDIRLQPAPGRSIVLDAPPANVLFQPPTISAETLP